MSSSVDDVWAAGELTETESCWEVLGLGSRRELGYLMNTEFLFAETKQFWARDSGKGFITLQICQQSAKEIEQMPSFTLPVRSWFSPSTSGSRGSNSDFSGLTGSAFTHWVTLPA